MKAEWRWYELLLPDLREFAKGVQKMKTLDEYYRLILISMAIVVFLPTYNLLADWDFYYSSWEEETDDSTLYDPDHYYKEIDTDAWYDDDPFVSGIEIEGFVFAYTWAAVWSSGDEYSNSFNLLAEAEIGCEKDFEWEGPPGEALGADIDGDLDAGTSTDMQKSVAARYPSGIQAETEADGDSLGWAESVAVHTGGYDMCTVGAVTEAYLDNSSSDLSYEFLSEVPDSNNWVPIINPNYSYAGTLTWSYSSSFEYEIPSGLTWFTVGACAIASGQSYVSIDADEQEFDEVTWSENQSEIEIYSLIEVDLN